MAVTIGNNIPSLQAQRRLAQSTDELGMISEKLSSGQRITRASDDAAGLAISQSLDTQKRLSTKAIQNLSDGSSMVSILSGALEQQKQITMRLAELAEQSASGTLSNNQRLVMSEEYEALVKEFGRIGDTTKFNGINLLQAIRDPKSAIIALQAGLDGGASSLLKHATIDTATKSGIIDLSQVLSNAFPSLEELPPDIGTLEELFAYSNVFIKTEFTDSEGGQVEAYITIFDTAGGHSAPSARIYVQASESDGSMGAANADDWVALNNPEDTYSYEEGSYNSNGTFSFQPTLFIGLTRSRTVTLTNNQFGSFQISDTPGYDAIIADRGGKTALEATGIETTGRARDALATTQRRLEQLNSYTSEVGAFERRLNTAISNLSNARTNFAAAQSRIADIDVAEASASYMAIQIRQKTAVAILGQANKFPELALALLQ